MRSIILLSLAVLAGGCGAPDRPPPPEADVIGAPLGQSLEKAGAVEDVSAGRKDGLDAAIDAAD